MKKLLLLFIFIAGYSQINAQIKATTETGNTVILYPNGTWKYCEAGIQAPAIKTTEATVTTLDIDTTANTKSEHFELFNDVSPKMAKYFGKEKGKIRCFSTLYNNKGQVQLRFEINVPVGDANRYFGRTLANQTITLTLKNDREIKIVLTKETDVKFIDKWNQSYFIGTGIINRNDLNAILQSPLEKVFIDWMKNPETYEVEDSSALQKALKEIL